MNKFLRCLIISSFALLLAACNDDGSLTSEKIPDGIYSGTWSEGSNERGDLYTLILNNEAYVLGDNSPDNSITQALPFTIKFSVVGESASGQARYYLNSNNTGTANLTGTLVSNGLSIKLKASDLVPDAQPNVQKEQGTADESEMFATALLQRQSLSDESASLDKLLGHFSQSDFINLDVSDTGVITGSDQSGCVYAGDVEIPDPSLNIYKVYYDVTNCPNDGLYNGSYSGLGALNSSADKFVVIISSTEHILYSVLTKKADD